MGKIYRERWARGLCLAGLAAALVTALVSGLVVGLDPPEGVTASAAGRSAPPRVQSSAASVALNVPPDFTGTHQASPRTPAGQLAPTVKRADEGATPLADIGTLEVILRDVQGRPAHVGLSVIAPGARSGFKSRTSASFLAHADADGNGCIVLEGLPTGVPLRLRVEPRAGVNAGVIHEHTESALSPSEVRTVEIDLGDLVLVRCIASVGGAPASGSIYGRTESALGPKYGQFDAELSVDGIAQVSLPRAKYVLEAWLSPGAHPLPARNVDLTEAVGQEPVEIAFSTRAKRPWRGRVSTSDGVPVSSREVMMSGRFGYRKALTAEDGTFEVPPLEARPFDVWVASRDGRFWSLGQHSAPKEGTWELDALTFDERLVRLKLVPLSDVPLPGRPQNLQFPEKGAPMGSSDVTTDDRGTVELWISVGPHEWTVPSLTGEIRVPSESEAPASPLLIEVPFAEDSSTVWQRPEVARAKGRVTATLLDAVRPFERMRIAMPGETLRLFLPVGRYELSYLAENGARVSDGVEVTRQ